MRVKTQMNKQDNFKRSIDLIKYKIPNKVSLYRLMILKLIRRLLIPRQSLNLINKVSKTKKVISYRLRILKMLRRKQNNLKKYLY